MAASIDVSTAAERLRAGGVVAFPTETVYGLGADARNPLAVRRVFALKRRPLDHPLIVHLTDAAAADALGVLDDRARRLADAFWPGPLTLVVPRRDAVPDEVTAGLPTVGLRVPDHELAQALARELGAGVAAPSANRFGRVSPTRPEHVREEFGDEVPVLDGGPCRVGVESTIVALLPARPPALLRPGGVPAEAVEAVVGPLDRRGEGLRAPGTLPAHYAPRTALRIAADPEAAAAELRAAGLQVAVLRAGPPEEYARRLYAELRALDRAGVDVLVAEPAAEGGLGTAINDRLLRAARGGGIAGRGGRA